MSFVSPAPRHPVAVSTSGSEVPRWRPPLGATELEHLLEVLGKWSPLVLDEIFDDLNTAQAAHTGTDPVELAQTAERLRRTLTYLISIGRTTPRLPPEIARTVECAASLVEPGPVGGELGLVQRLVKRAGRRDVRADLGRLRRLAWLTEDLVQQMSANRLIKDEI